MRILAGLCIAPRELLFLQACLLEGSSARGAWTQWTSTRTASTAPEDLALERAFATLLGRSATTSGFALEPSHATRLKAQRVIELRRRDEYLSILARVLESLASAAVPFVLVSGGALAETIYPEPVLRHVHDIDVLVDEGAIARAVSALVADGCEGIDDPTPGAAERVRHPSGLPILLHRRPVRHEWGRSLPFDVLHRRSRDTSIAGVGVRVLARPHALIHACTNSLGGSRSAGALRWVTDAWFLLAEADAPFWDDVVGTSVDHGLAPALGVTLQCIDQHIGGSVPSGVLRDLARKAALDTFGVGRRVVPLLRAAPRSTAALRTLDLSWPVRVQLAACLAVPAAEHVSGYAKGSGTMSVARAHLARIAAHLRHSTRGRPS